MADDLSRPSWSDRDAWVKGVLALLCFMIVAFCVVMVTDRSHNNICSSVSVTLYVASGILFKGFPGGSTDFIKIARDGSVTPQAASVEHMSNEKEFFRSKAEIDAWSRDLDAFGPFLESYKESIRDERVQFGVWMSTLVDGNSDISWHPIRKGIQYMPSPRLSGSPTTKLALSDMPSHDGPVSLTASDPKSGDLFEWKLLLATDAITGKASVVKASLDFANSAHFDSIFNAIRSG
eukprot:162901_1